MKKVDGQIIGGDRGMSNKRPHEAPEWIWYGEVDGKPVVTFGRWPKGGTQWRYKWAEIQPTEHDHPKKCTTCNGRGYVVEDSEWEPVAVKCPTCSLSRPASNSEAK